MLEHFGLRLIESEWCTVDKVTWSLSPRTWKERLFSGRPRTFRRQASAFTLFVLAMGFMPSALSLFAIASSFLLLVRPRRWRISIKPVKQIYKVPDPNLYRMGDTIVGHPAMIRGLKEELESLPRKPFGQY